MRSVSLRHSLCFDFSRIFPSFPAAGVERCKSLLQRGALVVLTGLSAAANAVDENISLPQDYPRGTNLLASCNPSFSGGLSSWTASSPTGVAPVYDSATSFAAGTGSLRFPSPTIPITPGGSGNFFSKATSCLVGSINRDKPYTVSMRVKSGAAPAYIEMVLFMYDASNNSLGYTNAKVGSVSAVDTWQEVSSVFTAYHPDAVSVRVGIETFYTGSTRPELHVDDVYFGEGVSFADRPPEAPTETRKTFASASVDKVKIDKWGNWQAYDTENSVWKDFFPFGLYPDLARSSYQLFADQGFNLVLSQQARIGWTNQLARAQAAVSAEFNPHGMYACLRLSRYAAPGDADFNLTNLPVVIADLTGGSLARTLLCYDWDNENNWTNGAQWASMVSTVRGSDLNRPIYVLNGEAAVQRSFYSLSDVAGTYVNFNSDKTAGGFETLQFLPGQRTPASIAQINDVENVEHGFRMRVYDALIKGARGIVHFGDGLPEVPDEDRHLELKEWWGEVPDLRREIDQLVPLLKQPFGVSWSATSSNSEILVGRRDLNGDGYLIVANPKGSDTKVTFTLTGIVPSEVWNYFDDAFVTLVQDGKFTVMLKAHSTVVYRLSTDPYAELLPNVGMEAAGSPLSAWNDYGPGTFTQDGSVKYNGSYSAKISDTSTTSDNTYLYYYGALQPGKTYRFTAMVKTNNVVKNNSANALDGAFIQLFASGGINQFLPTPALSGTNDWQLVQKTFVAPSPSCAPPCANAWYVRLRLWNASGEVWFDNVSLKELPLP